MLKGSCLCGEVSFEIDGPVKTPRYCHCSRCRKFSGTAAAAWGLIQTGHLRIRPAAPRITRFDSGGGLRVFCAVCGSPLWYEPAGFPQFRGIPLGAIDSGEVPAPEMHVWTSSQVPWASIADGLPVHDQHP